MNWISVEERLPEIGIDVLVMSGGRKRLGFLDKMYDDGSLKWRNEEGSFLYANCAVTKWMPLPE